MVTLLHSALLLFTALTVLLKIVKAHCVRKIFKEFIGIVRTAQLMKTNGEQSSPRLLEPSTLGIVSRRT